MAKWRQYVPIRILIAVVILLILGSVAGPIIRSSVTERQLATNVLLSAIPFILVFVAIILTFISLIIVAARILNHKISPSIHRPIELLTIAGIVFGVFGMLQSWSFGLYRISFPLLLIATLGFIFWSHVVPRGAVRDAGDLGTVSTRELQKAAADTDSGGQFTYS